MSKLIALVEDDKNINDILSSYLLRQGWQVLSFLSGEDARAASIHPHLWILDIMLPGIDGYQLIREIKARTPEVPVIFISARDADIDRIVGLEMGSEDYLAKPFMPEELVIRTRKVLDRVYKPAKRDEEQGSQLMLGPYIIDLTYREVFRLPERERIELTAKEFDLLHLFVRHHQQQLDREQILQYVWGSEYFGSDRVVDNLVRRVRRKLPELRLETIYGYGYRLVEA
ncbi:MAG: response regulator transcription factor [Syntrophomonadaceae bacterium]|nr:response regulator transcription factor [Syntrophomonadaceae bacterium]